MGIDTDDEWDLGKYRGIACESAPLVWRAKEHHSANTIMDLFIKRLVLCDDESL